jgi:hypothetical protein
VEIQKRTRGLPTGSPSRNDAYCERRPTIRWPHHKFNQAVWPHIGPIFIYELKASGTVVRFVYYGPAFGNIDEAWPQGMLAFSVYQNMIDAVFVVEWIRHFVLH